MSQIKCKTELRKQLEIEQLIIDIAQGDSHAIEMLYRKTSKNIFGYALSILKNPTDTEDVLHDCYMQIIKRASSYQSVGKPMAWVMTIAKNLCYDAMRERKKTKMLPEMEQFKTIAEQNNLSHEESILLNECMNGLCDGDRQIVVLHAICGYKHYEIADWLQLPLSTVLSKYRRALLKLRTAMLKGDLYNDG